MPQKLPFGEFLKTFEKVPRVAISLLVENSEDAVLLTKRSIPPEKGSWHLPGSFILKDERIEECIKRILKTELGCESKFSYKVEKVSENLSYDPRGHVIDIIYRVEEAQIIPQETEESAEVKYFKHLPKDIGFNHLEVLHTLQYK